MGQTHPKTMQGPATEMNQELGAPVPADVSTCQPASVNDDHGGEGNKKEESPISSVPMSKKQPLSKKDSGSGKGGATGAGISVPNKPKKKLFQRQSSKRIFPDETDIGALSENTSGPMSPTDPNKNHTLLFSGTLAPVSFSEMPEAAEGFLSTTQLYNSLNDGQLSPLKYDPTFMLIIDTRSRRDFTKLHIMLARHVSELRDGKDMEPLDVYTMLILYDHKGLSHSLKDSTLGQTLRSLQNEGLDPFVLSGGFDLFHKKHPYLCTSKVATSGYERHKLISCYPSIIVPDQLYLGRGDQATNLQIVDDLQLTHIINVTCEHPNAFEAAGKIKYLKIDMDDDSSSELSETFPTCIEFINDAVSKGGRLMVHCNLGMSRSSTVLMAYLMYTQKWILRDAYAFLRERRPIVRPNSGFMKQLESFEEILFGKKYTDIAQISGYRSYGNSK